MILKVLFDEAKDFKVEFGELEISRSGSDGPFHGGSGVYRDNERTGGLVNRESGAEVVGAVMDGYRVWL
ncbi:unnamed protein product [Arabis nemorensis]|uniref:Uncharacterized protein n=1 Tax=Arabis nemorensis TaxID=586526 RepID=A0A565CCJ5_9BRAS|nr:unnamed protein product [Arabis nemorensis]